MDRRSFLAASVLTLNGQAHGGERRKSEIDRLIERLGSKKFREREAASQALKAMGRAAFPALRIAARTHADPEVRRRARELINAVDQPRCIRVFPDHDSWVTSVALSGDGRWALSCDNSAWLWDTSRTTVFSKVAYTHADARGGTDSVMSVAFAPTGKHAMLGCTYSGLRYVALPSGKQLRAFQGHQGAVYSVVFSRDGRRVLSGSQDGTARLWDLDTGKECRRFSCKLAVRAVAFLDCGREVATTGLDSAIRIWNAANGKERGCLRGHQFDVFGLAISQDGRLAASASQDGTVRLWELRARKELHCLRQHIGPVNAVALSPDGRRVLSGGADNTVRLWSAKTGAHLECLTGHTRDVTSVCFSADGRMALSASQDRTLRLWRLPP